MDSYYLIKIVGSFHSYLLKFFNSSMSGEKMRLLIYSVLIVFLSACTTVQQSTRLSSSLSAKEYNSVTSRYMERPTFSSLDQMSDGQSVITVTMDGYGSQTNIIRFSKDHVAEYLPLLRKFNEWEQLASSRGDSFTKEVGRAETWGNALSADLKFTFHSGNARVHYLSVSFCAVGTCLDEEAMYFDKINTLELVSLLENFQLENIRQNDVDNIYK